MPFPAAGERTSAAAQSGDNLGPRILEDRYQAEEHSRRQRHPQRKSYHREINRNLMDARQPCDFRCHQRPQAGIGKSQSERASGNAQQRAFEQQLSRQTRPVRPQGRANREFVLASIGPHQEQVRDIRTRDCQHDDHGAHQHP